jgi:hypothetical protein
LPGASCARTDVAPERKMSPATAQSTRSRIGFSRFQTF